jgi:hypothetical protein
MAKILGSITTYHGTEHGYLRGCTVRIVGVMKRAATPDYDPVLCRNWILQNRRDIERFLLVRMAR